MKAEEIKEIIVKYIDCQDLDCRLFKRELREEFLEHLEVRQDTKERAILSITVRDKDDHKHNNILWCWVDDRYFELREPWGWSKTFMISRLLNEMLEHAHTWWLGAKKPELEFTEVP